MIRIYFVYSRSEKERRPICDSNVFIEYGFEPETSLGDLHNDVINERNDPVTK